MEVALHIYTVAGPIAHVWVDLPKETAFKKMEQIQLLYSDLPEDVYKVKAFIDNELLFHIV